MNIHTGQKMTVWLLWCHMQGFSAGKLKFCKNSVCSKFDSIQLCHKSARTMRVPQSWGAEWCSLWHGLTLFFTSKQNVSSADNLKEFWWCVSGLVLSFLFRDTIGNQVISHLHVDSNCNVNADWMSRIKIITTFSRHWGKAFKLYMACWLQFNHSVITQPMSYKWHTECNKFNIQLQNHIENLCPTKV